MACVHPHSRRAASMAYRLMIVTAFVMLMPYTVPAAEELAKEAVLPICWRARRFRHRWMRATKMATG